MLLPIVHRPLSKSQVGKWSEDSASVLGVHPEHGSFWISQYYQHSHTTGYYSEVWPTKSAPYMHYVYAYKICITCMALFAPKVKHLFDITTSTIGYGFICIVLVICNILYIQQWGLVYSTMYVCMDLI